MLSFLTGEGERNQWEPWKEANTISESWSLRCEVCFIFLLSQSGRISTSQIRDLPRQFQQLCSAWPRVNFQPRRFLKAWASLCSTLQEKKTTGGSERKLLWKLFLHKEWLSISNAAGPRQPCPHLTRERCQRVDIYTALQSLPGFRQARRRAQRGPCPRHPGLQCVHRMGWPGAAVLSQGVQMWRWSKTQPRAPRTRCLGSQNMHVLFPANKGGSGPRGTALASLGSHQPF